MKFALASMLLILNGYSIAQSINGNNLAWDINLTPDTLRADAYNPQNVDLTCSVSYSVSMLDEFGLVRGFKILSFENYLLMRGQSYSFEIHRKNIINAENYTFGELSVENKLNCYPKFYFLRSNTVIESMIGALKNSDLDSAVDYRNEYFQADFRGGYEIHLSNIKVLDVSNSSFNSPEAQETLGLNHIEIERTTLAIDEAKNKPQVCEMRKSLKCGHTFVKDRSFECGVESYYPKGSKIETTCKRYEYDPDFRPIPFKCAEYYSWTSDGKMANYKECEHPSHGIEDAKSCPLKLLKSGAFEKCEL